MKTVSSMRDISSTWKHRFTVGGVRGQVPQGASQLVCTSPALNLWGQTSHIHIMLIEMAVNIFLSIYRMLEMLQSLVAGIKNEDTWEEYVKKKKKRGKTLDTYQEQAT